jgi:3-hydroxymyristoyl/3-hydroxydecanoyl-(acyl carrier protein) dehydratase
MLTEVDDPLSKNMFFSGVEGAKFRKPIIPGDQMNIHVSLIKKKLSICKFQGKCMVNDNIVAEANFSANIVPRKRG